MSFQMDFRVLLSLVYLGTIVLLLTICLSALTSIGYSLSLRVGVWVSFLSLCHAAYKEDRFLGAHDWPSCEFIRVTERAWGTPSWEVPWVTHRPLHFYMFPRQFIGSYMVAIVTLGSLETTRGSQEGLVSSLTLFPPSTREH